MTSSLMGEQPKFSISGALLAGTTLTFVYEVGSETGIVRERLVNGPVSELMFYKDKKGAMDCASEFLLDALQKKYDAINTGFSNRKAGLDAKENISSLMKEIEESSGRGDYRGIELIPSPAREIEGAFLPVGAPIYVVDMDRGDPEIDTYKVDDYLYFGGTVLYYQCMPVPGETPEGAVDFRITSDYVRDGGKIFLPASRGEKTAMFWTKFAAQEHLENITSDQNYDPDEDLMALNAELDALNEGAVGGDLGKSLEEMLAELSEIELDQDSAGPEMTMG